VIETIKVDLRSPVIVRALLQEAQQMEAPDANEAAIERGYSQMAALDRRINGLMAGLAETTAKRPLLEQIERWEQERETIRGTLAREEQSRALRDAMARVTQRDIEQALDEFSQTLAALPAAEQRDVLRGIVERIELDPVSLTGRIGYAMPIKNPGIATGVSLASPRGFEPRLPP
jgi:hypothetical protein